MFATTTYNSDDSYTIALSKSGAPQGPVASGFTLRSMSFEKSIFNASSYVITLEASKYRA